MEGETLWNDTWSEMGKKNTQAKEVYSQVQSHIQNNALIFSNLFFVVFLVLVWEGSWQVGAS